MTTVHNMVRIARWSIADRVVPAVVAVFVMLMLAYKPPHYLAIIVVGAPVLLGSALLAVIAFKARKGNHDNG